MCGFAGVLSPASSTTSTGERAAALREMTAAVRHRGPDDEAIWMDPAGHFDVGFCRLAIIDLSSRGRQPMTSQRGRFVVAYNGEIYNFAELKRDLQGLGCTFVGRSDTEVLVAALDEWGVDRSL